jgi:hypothetical protein
MEPLDEARSRRTLEVGPDATLDEITRSYHLLKRIYAKDLAVFTAPAMDEFAVDARREVLEEIEAAYALLCGKAQAQPAPLPARTGEPDRPPAAPRTVLGRAREAAGMTLDQVAAETHVRPEYLAALEQEDFQGLPLAPVNVRGYLTAFVQAVRVPEEDVVTGYMARFVRWHSQRR